MMMIVFRNIKDNIFIVYIYFIFTVFFFFFFIFMIPFCNFLSSKQCLGRFRHAGRPGDAALSVE